MFCCRAAACARVLFLPRSLPLDLSGGHRFRGGFRRGAAWVGRCGSGWGWLLHGGCGLGIPLSGG